MKRLLSIIIVLCICICAVPVMAENGDDVIFYLDFEGELPLGMEECNLTYFEDGAWGRYVWFNGGTSYIKLPDNVTKGVKDYTLSLWLNMTGLEKGWQRIFDFGSGTDNYAFFGIPYPTANLRTAYKIYPNDEYNKDAEGVNVKNSWQHIAFTQCGKKISTYVNGEKVAEGETEYTLDDLGETLSNYMGRSQFDSDPKLNAYADEVLFAKRAYTDEEIKALAKTKRIITKEDILKKLEIYGKDSIKENISLPDEVMGYDVKWSSDNEDIVSVCDIQNGDYVIRKGKVTRQDENVSVTITATLDVEGEIITKEQVLNIVAKPEPVGETVGYFYVYFRGYVDGSDEHLSIHIAQSEDGYNWFDLNDNKPILTSEMGTRCLRDPYLLRSKDGDRFYLMATDLNTQDSQGWGPWSLEGSKYLMIWESDDLINWSEQRMVKFANDDIGCAWAPEAIWDPDTEEYLVYASGKDLTMQSPADTVYVVKTRDFRTFSEPEYFVAPVNADGERIWAIDSNIIKGNDGKYYMFYKQSGHIEMMVSDHASGGYEIIDEFVRPAGEGPGSFLIKGTDDTYALMVDDYSVYVPYISEDIASGKFHKATDTITMPTGSKHGGFLPLTQEEYERVMNKWNYVSRSEALSAIMIKSGFEASDEAFFEDTRGDVNEGYINAAAQLGIAKGAENGNFEPDRNITYNEWALFTARASGMEDNDALLRQEDDEISKEEFKKLIAVFDNRADGAGMGQIIEEIRDAERENPDRIKEMKEKSIACGDVTMRYDISVKGVQPVDGYSVYIALHGGGQSDTPDINDSQWNAMKTYYRGSVENGIYIAPRGVRDTWDTHFNPESYYCYMRLIENMSIFYNINPDRIYLVGYSAGGDGVYQITARMADFFAAANMSAGHPNGVDLTNVKNMPLYLQCGENDSDYDRNKETVKYGENENVRGVFIHKDKGHNFTDNGQGLWHLTDGSYRDTNAIRLVSNHKRDPYPENIEWNLELKKSDMFYYVQASAEEGFISVKRDGNTFTVEGDVDAIYVNTSFIDAKKPIKVIYNGKEMEFEYEYSEETVMETYKKRFDKSLTFGCKLNLKGEQE